MLSKDSVALIKRQRERAEELKKLHHGNPLFPVWLNQTERIFSDAFGQEAQEYQQFHTIFYGPVFISTSTPDSEFQKDYLENLEKAQLMLGSFLEDLAGKEPSNRLKCPKCGSEDLKFLENRDMGSVEYRAGVRIVGGKKESTKVMALYTCNSCSRVFAIDVDR